MLDLGLTVDDVAKTSDDWYTPPWIFNALALNFDLDVAAPVNPLPWIPARKHYSLIDDGLNQDWYGRIWMNPPYSNPTEWVNKFVKHNNGVALVPTSTGKWMLDFWSSSTAWLMLPPMKFVQSNLIEAKGALPIRCWLIAAGAENINALHKSELGWVR